MYGKTLIKQEKKILHSNEMKKKLDIFNRKQKMLNYNKKNVD